MKPEYILFYRDGNDETASNGDSDSKISDESAEKLIANAIREKVKNITGNDQQGSISRSFSVRNGIKTSKRDQIKIKRRTKDQNRKDKKWNHRLYNHGHGWGSLHNKIKRGKKAAFGVNAKRNITRIPQKKQVNTETEAASLHIKGVKKPCRISDEEAAMALNVHRAYRKEEHARNMWSLDWDQDLAELAQGLADECVFKHTNLEFANGVRVGQNLGATTGSNHSIERMVHLFMNEKADYNYTEHKWTNVVGHYLQVSLFFKSNNTVVCFRISIDL
ncbi:unnamed protein product [Mytilus edulis]|uniref:SCP domain-containing protein n=1 Tax=Mytilus edulis TaxID=6550 RepID=A0A8S3QC77_MYTED|nr:unnamed protein product [Mytilus edulis]